MVLSFLLPGVILGSAASQPGCWGSNQSGQAPSNQPSISLPTPPNADLYGVVKAVDSAEWTISLRVEKDGKKPQEIYEVAKDATILLEAPGDLADLAAGSRVALVSGADGKTVSEIRTEPFYIVVTPQTKPIEVDKRFDVELCVVNASELPQSFLIMSCSWNDQWQSSNPRVSLDSWGCARNVLTAVKLAPGETHTKVLWMQANAAGMESFQMGLTPLKDKLGSRPWPGKRTYWSSEVTIEVNEDQGK
jgi:hypothetical protein